MTRQEEKDMAALCIATTSSLNYVLLVKRKDVPVWVIPGGGIEKDESAAQGALRELQEETGLKPHTVYTILTLDKSCSCFSSTTHIFLTIVEEEEAQQQKNITPCPIETTDARYFSIYQLPSTLFPLHKRWLQEALSHAPFVLSHNALPIRRPLDELSWTWVALTILRHPFFSTRYLLSLTFRKIIFCIRKILKTTNLS